MKFFVVFFALFALALASPQWGGFEGIDHSQNQDGYDKFQGSHQKGEYRGSTGFQKYEQRGPGFGTQHQHQKIGRQW